MDFRFSGNNGTIKAHLFENNCTFFVHQSSTSLSQHVYQNHPSFNTSVIIARTYLADVFSAITIPRILTSAQLEKQGEYE